ncbi:GABA/polyamine transporter [Exophiala oligosperma]
MLTLSTSVASFAWATASSIHQAIVMLQPDWEATNAQLMAVSFAFVFIWMSLAAFRLEDITWIYLGGAAILFVHFIIYVIALPVTHATQHQPWASGKDAFGNYTNYSDWNRAVAVPFTFFTSIWTNSAWSAPAYIVESTHNGRSSAARAVVDSYLVTAVGGVVVCVIAAFCIPNMDDAAADPSGYPLFTMIQTHFGTKCTAAFLLIPACVTGLGGSAQTLSYGSQIAAFARDGGVPFSNVLSRVDQRVNMPVPAILSLGVASCLVLLFALSSVASQIIYSLSTIAYLLTMGLPNWLRLFAGDRWVPGPFNYGRWSKPIYLLAGLGQLWLAVMESFPPEREWTASTLNYSWCLTLGVIIFAMILYRFLGKNYTGPDFEALEHYRHDLVEGLAPTHSVQERDVDDDVQAFKGPNVKTSDDDS